VKILIDSWKPPEKSEKFYRNQGKFYRNQEKIYRNQDKLYRNQDNFYWKFTKISQVYRSFKWNLTTFPIKFYDIPGKLQCFPVTRIWLSIRCFLLNISGRIIRNSTYSLEVVKSRFTSTTKCFSFPFVQEALSVNTLHMVYICRVAVINKLNPKNISFLASGLIENVPRVTTKIKTHEKINFADEKTTNNLTFSTAKLVVWSRCLNRDCSDNSHFFQSVMSIVDGSLKNRILINRDPLFLFSANFRPSTTTLNHETVVPEGGEFFPRLENSRGINCPRFHFWFTRFSSKENKNLCT